MAIVHYWMMRHGGGERVVAALARLFPQADIFSVVAQPGAEKHVAGHRLTTSFVQRIPGSLRYHRHFLPLYPFALEQFDLHDYDLVISSDSGPAKGVITSANTLHIAYCHSPMRFLWEFYHQYIHGQEMRGPGRMAFAAYAHYMRLWDVAAAQRVDAFIANSANVAARIQKVYRRNAEVIYPPVDTDAGYIVSRPDDYYLAVGRLVGYKRFDLAIDACRKLNRKLRIVGDGPRYKALKKLAGGQAQFLGELSDDALWEHYAHCRALLFPGEEDFGIVPVEVQSCGRPAIAYGAGGALETVVNMASDEPHDSSSSPTGVLFNQQSVESLCAAMLAYESNMDRFVPLNIRAHACRFSISRFERQMLRFINQQRSCGKEMAFANTAASAIG